MSMNVFRLAADFSHVLAIFILLFKIWKTRSCSGISGRTQILYAIVFTTRYLDLFQVYISAYNSALKALFLATTYGILFLIYVKFRATYNKFDRTHDTFRIEFLLIPAALLALAYNYDLTTYEVLWAFSIYLEAVAILPQLFMIYQAGQAESFINLYIFALGLYRGLYIANWIYRYYAEEHYDIISVVGGTIQTIMLFCHLIVRPEKESNLVTVKT